MNANHAQLRGSGGAVGRAGMENGAAEELLITFDFLKAEESEGREAAPSSARCQL